MNPLESNIKLDSYGILLQDNFESNFDEEYEQIKRIGYTVIDSGYSSETIEQISTDFDMMREAYIQKYGEEILKQTNELYNIRFANFMGSSLIYQLCFNVNVLNIVKRAFIGSFVMVESQGVVNPPGEGYSAGKWHRDLPYQHFTSTTLGITSLYCVDDFTISNGATAVIPTSHKSVAFPSNKYIKRNAIQLEAKAGQFLVIDSMLFHTGGFNITNKPRRTFTHLYTIPYINTKIQHFNMYAQLQDMKNKNLFDEEIIMTEEEKVILGVLDKPRTLSEYLDMRIQRNQKNNLI